MNWWQRLKTWFAADEGGVALGWLGLRPDRELWPPPEHRERLAWYDIGYRLFQGRHEEVFEPYRPPGDRPYLTVNVLGLITRLCARRLFGRPARYSAPSAQELVDLLAAESRLDLLNVRQAQTASYGGDAVYKVRYDAARDRVVIEGVNPAFFFPTFADDQQSEIATATIAWVVADQESDRRAWLRKEIHEPGLVRHELWELAALPGGEWAVGEQRPLAALPRYAALPEAVVTGVEELLVVHVPNQQVAEDGLWGVSDYETVFALQGELNNRATRLAATLDLHASPRMYGPKSLLDERGEFVADESEFIIVREGETPPGYLVWDAQLDVVKTQLDDLRLDILRGAGISPESMGLNPSGGQADSGRAIRLRQLETTATVQAKGTLFDAALRQVLSVGTTLHAAQVQDQARRPGAVALEPDEITIVRADGPPRDDLEDAELGQRWIESGLLSPETARQRLFGMTAEEAVAETVRVA